MPAPPTDPAPDPPLLASPSAWPAIAAAGVAVAWPTIAATGIAVARPAVAAASIAVAWPAIAATGVAVARPAVAAASIAIATAAIACTAIPSTGTAGAAIPGSASAGTAVSTSVRIGNCASRSCAAGTGIGRRRSGCGLSPQGRAVQGNRWQYWRVVTSEGIDALPILNKCYALGLGNKPAVEDGAPIRAGRREQRGQDGEGSGD
jgi:hypothetical protein